MLALCRFMRFRRRLAVRNSLRSVVDRLRRRDLATELKRFYPELLNWPDKSLATAWRSYSQKVGLVTEEYVCVREPNFLAFLYVNQEGWPTDEKRWIETLDG